MAKKNKTVDKVRQLFNAANGSHRVSWERASQRGYNFYLDNQLTQTEKNELESRGMPTFTINRITPVIEMLVFYATASRPRWQAVGREGSDTDIATLFSDVASYVWEMSNGGALYANAITDACAKGMGYLMVDVDPDMDNGMGEVVIKQIEPYDVWVDPKSRDPLFKDASYIMMRKILPREQLLRLFPNDKRKIKKASGTTQVDYSYGDKITDEDQQDFQYKDISESWDLEGARDDVLELFEVFHKEKNPFYRVFFKVPPTKEEMAQVKQQVQEQMQRFMEEIQVSMLEQQQKIQMAAQSGQMIPQRAELEMKKLEEESQMAVAQKEKELTAAMVDRFSKTEEQILPEKVFNEVKKDPKASKMVIDFVKFYNEEVIKTCVVGDKLIYKTTMPSAHYPIIPFSYKWTGTPYPMSAVMPLVGKQQEINKSHQLMVHNASLGSSLRWIYEKGSIDEEYWEKYGAAPGALLPKNPGFENPTPVIPAPLSNAFGQIVQMDKYDMEYLSGMYSSMMGDISSQHETYRGVLATDEYGTRRVKNWMKNSIEPSLKQFGEVVKDYTQAVYTAHKVFRLVQPSAIQEQRSQEVNVPIYNDFGEAIGKWKDYATAKFDVQIVAASTLPVNRWAYLSELKELLQFGVIDDIAVLAETDIKNKERIVARKSQYAQMAGQLQQMEASIKDREGTIETLERQLVQSGIKNKVMQASVEINKKKEEVKSELNSTLTDTGAKQKVLQSMLQQNAETERQKRAMATRGFIQDLDREIQNVKESETE